MEFSGQKVELQELEELLKKCIDNKLKLLNHKVTKLLPFGENYCSTMLKVSATILTDSKEKKLELVAKSGSDCEKYPMTWSKIFKKEVFVYCQLIPMYKELQLEMGVDENEVFNNIAKFYGYRNSLKEGQEEADRNSLMLFENLKLQGYYTANRRMGMDYYHARKSIEILAKYHALGIAIKQKREEFFEIVKSNARIVAMSLDEVSGIFDITWETSRNAPSFAKYLNIIKASFDYCKSGKEFTTEPKEPWATITHGDFWCNNMLFHKNCETEEVDDVKFCDFQLYYYYSPFYDLINILITSINEETETKHFDELLDCYYETFINTIEVMHCVGNFSKKHFNEELKEQAKLSLAKYILYIKFSITEAEEKKDDEKNFTTVIENKKDDIFINRLSRLIHVYERKNWL